MSWEYLEEELLLAVSVLLLVQVVFVVAVGVMKVVWDLLFVEAAWAVLLI